jgi:uncharacterized protein (TIGR02646 family)
MRHLDRAAVPAPACLARLRLGTPTWSDLSWEDREEIRAQLGLLQNTHCAYCECDLTQESQNPHIEHFEQRSRAPAKTFEWSNLFWSCTHTERCGKQKDRLVKTYKPAELLKPDVDEPRVFLFFGEKGEVSPRLGLSAPNRRRAEETIRVFALDHGTLVMMRKAYLAGPRSELQGAEEAGFTPEEALEYTKDLVSAYANSPFSAAILELLGGTP